MTAIKITKTGIMMSLLITAIFLVTLYFAIPEFDKPEFAPNLYTCQGQLVPFRANISDCLAVQSTDEQQLANTLTNPLGNNILILVDPKSPSHVGLAANEIYKIGDSVKPKTGIDHLVVFTQFWNETPNVPVMSIEDATFENPIIWLRTNQSTTNIEQNGAQIIVNSDSEYGLDAAACKIAIILMEDALTC